MRVRAEHLEATVGARGGGGPAPSPASATESVQLGQQLAYSINFRDVGCVGPPGALCPARVYRSSQLLSPADLAARRVRSVLDLRQAPPLCAVHEHNVRQALRRAHRAP